MKKIVVGIGEIRISNVPDTSIITYSLGSCVAVVFYDTFSKTAAMAHIALSNSRIDRKRSLIKPGYFADTAIALICAQLKKRGCKINKENIVVKIAGGAAKLITNDDLLNVGQKNINAVKKHIKSKGLVIHNADVGGDYSRTVKIDVTSGTVHISNKQMGTWQL